MGEKRNQHFVPKCILRQFGTDDHLPVGDRRQISMLNIARRKIIRDTSIKDQCAAKYLYGEDLIIENMLGPLEGIFNETIKRIISAGTINDNIAPRWETALMLAVQAGRTTAAEEDTNVLAEKMARLVCQGEIDRETLESIKLTINDAAAMNVSNHVLMSPIMFDLKQILIVNKTSRSLIISDNPVCITNWFFKRHMPHLNTGGTGSAGIQIFMPVSPRYMLLLIVNNVYSTGGSANSMEITSPIDIDHINHLQYLNSFKNLYFNNMFTDQDVDVLLKSSKPERTRFFERSECVNDVGRYAVTDKSEFDPPTPGARSELLRISTHKLQECLRLKQIKIRSKPKYFDNGSLAGPIRDPAWMQIIRDFRKYLDNQSEIFSDIDRFVASHPLRDRVGNWIRE